MNLSTNVQVLLLRGNIDSLAALAATASCLHSQGPCARHVGRDRGRSTCLRACRADRGDAAGFPAKHSSVSSRQRRTVRHSSAALLRRTGSGTAASTCREAWAGILPLETAVQ